MKLKIIEIKIYLIVYSTYNKSMIINIIIKNFNVFQPFWVQFVVIKIIT
jgi:hypothetical protein